MAVPTLDFLALLALAAGNATGGAAAARLAACMGGAAQQQAVLLRPHLQALQLGPATPAWDRATFQVLQWSWGAYGALLTVRPQAPVPSSLAQRCSLDALLPSADGDAAPAPAGTSGSGSTTMSAGVVAAIVVGGVALLAAVALSTWLLVRRHRRYRCVGHLPTS